MPAEVIQLDDHRRVWRVVKGECRSCGHTGVSTQHAGCPLDTAECPGCAGDTWAVTHYLAVGSDGGEPEWEPRLEAVN